MQRSISVESSGRTLDTPISRSVASEAIRPIELHRSADRATTTSIVERRGRSARVERIVNVAIASAGIVASAPLFVLVAIGVRVTSKGPILYRQTRVGIDRRRRRTGEGTMDRRACDLGGSVFNMYKFRSMYVDAESRSGAVWATKNDPRITPFGRFLRKTRLDELPQLFNVLIGNMNIVGPRPERPSIFARLSRDIPDYALRQRAKPGITGWAQINQSYDSCLEDVRNKVRYDLEYIDRASLAEDLRIMLRTVPVMVFKRGAH